MADGVRGDVRRSGQGQRALPGAQGLHGEVQGGQRRRARRVDGHGRAFEAEDVGDAARRHAAEHAGHQVAVELRGRRQAEVALFDEPGEDSGTGALEAGRIDAGALERLPGRLQQQALLRVHGQGLPRGDPEEGGVEPCGVLQEPAVPDMGAAGLGGIRVVEVVQVPAAIRREVRDGIGLVHDQLPQGGRGVGAGEAAGHADDGDGLVPARLQFGDAPAGLLQVGGDLLEVLEQFVFVGHGGHGEPLFLCVLRGGVVPDQSADPPSWSSMRAKISSAEAVSMRPVRSADARSSSASVSRESRVCRRTTMS